MNVIPLKTPTRNELLDHVDDLLERVKEYNDSSNDLKVSKVVLSGNILTPSKLETSLLFQFKNSKGEIFPPVLSLEQNLTEKEQKVYLENENKWFESHNFLNSNYVKIKSLAEKEVSKLKRGDAKIVFSDNIISSPALKYSLNIKKDYFDEKKTDLHLAKMSKRPKI